MWPFGVSLGSSHLVLVGWVELVPRFWVVLLVKEAANMEQFRTRRIKRGRKKTSDQGEKGLMEAKNLNDKNKLKRGTEPERGLPNLGNKRWGVGGL